MRVALVGSRDWPLNDVIKRVVQSLEPGDIVVSGGARGADTIAENLARDRGLKTHIFTADWERHGKAAGFIRNKDIVKNVDRVIAFLVVDRDGNGSRGTMNTIGLARKAGKPVTIWKYNHVRTWVEN